MDTVFKGFLAACVLGTGITAVQADNLPPLPKPPAPFALPKLNAQPAQNGNTGRNVGQEMECMLEPYLVVNVGSPVEGTLAAILVNRGANVRKGQVVARLNSEVEEATVKWRRAQEEFGKRKVQRNEELFKKELISASDKDELETQTRLAGLELKQQLEVLNQRTIRSPINGVVVERFLAPGEHVSQEKILKLAQISPLNVEVIAPVEMFGSIKPGMWGTVRLDPILKETYKAKVVVVDRVIDAASGTFGVRLQLANPGNKIPAGLKCRVSF